jgi:cytochrome c5
MRMSLYNASCGRLLVSAVALLFVAACPGTHSAPPATDSELIERAKAITPDDARLAQLYSQACRACHTVASSGAPLTGDRVAWDARWDKGIETLRSNTIRGLNGMPAGGQCFTCSVQDYEALIRFMAGR